MSNYNRTDIMIHLKGKVHDIEEVPNALELIGGSEPAKAILEIVRTRIRSELGKLINSLSEKDRRELETAIALFRGHGAHEIFLFGSMARGSMDEANPFTVHVPAKEEFQPTAVLS